MGRQIFPLFFALFLHMVFLVKKLKSIMTHKYDTQSFSSILRALSPLKQWVWPVGWLLSSPGVGVPGGVSLPVWMALCRYEYI